MPANRFMIQLLRTGMLGIKQSLYPQRGVTCRTACLRIDGGSYIRRGTGVAEGRPRPPASILPAGVQALAQRVRYTQQKACERQRRQHQQSEEVDGPTATLAASA